MVPTVEWQDGEVVLIDQRRLPAEQVMIRCRTHSQVAAAIKDMAIRGAPAIGVAAALGIALGVRNAAAEGPALQAEFDRICQELASTRPTAVNLFWAIARMRGRFVTEQARGGAALRKALLDEALALQSEDLAACRRMGDIGAELIPTGARLLTALMVALAPISIVRGVITDVQVHGVSLHTMFGVLCIYLLLGTFFAFLYGVDGALSSGAFFAQQDAAESTKNFLYFSFVTITTVGYGDLTAATNLGRSLAIAEALTGQIYLVTVVAGIVGGLGARRRA